ncbi:hypothetical protein QQF64_019181 [Cirrhinus molitorella]|uniref:Uncharacterized protein n=1 Tax=Cirrhinus molitorella TaxID=172907 RepID=A0ABR3LG48_9TELE
MAPMQLMLNANCCWKLAEGTDRGTCGETEREMEGCGADERERERERERTSKRGGGGGLGAFGENVVMVSQ